MDVKFGRLDFVVTWTSATTFTTTLGSLDDSIQVGDEVEVLSGVNAGLLAHVTIISGAHGALQTFTIDQTADLGSSTSAIRFDRWKKLKNFTIGDRYEEPVNIGIDSSFIQFKVELRGPAQDMNISDLIVTSKPSIKIEG